MKKLCSIVLVFTMAFMFCACGNDTINTALTEPTQNPETNLVSAVKNTDIQKDTEKKETPTPTVSTPIQKEAVSKAEQTFTFIANKNTKKFHYAHCYSIKRMKEANKKYLNCTRSDAISQGYTPCGHCNP